MNAREESGDRSYDVFISYSHADRKLCDRLVRRLERYRPPRGIGGPKRRLRVFRDIDRLTTHPRLGDALEERIRASRHLLLLASPAAATSPYVAQESAAFLQWNQPANLIIALVDGELPDSLPPGVGQCFEEPLYADLRPLPGKRPGWRRFRDQSLRIIASVLQVDYDALYRRERKRRRQEIGIGALLMFMLLGLAGSAWLIGTVPPERWERVAVPEQNSDSDLIVIRDAAIHHQQPGSIRLLAQDNRNYAHERALEELRQSGDEMAVEAYNDSFIEAWDGAWAEWHLLQRLNGETGFHEIRDGETAWEQTVASEQWLRYQPPQRQVSPEMPRAYRDRERLPAELRDLLDRTLSPLAGRYETEREVIRVTRDDAGRLLQAATVREIDRRQMGITRTTSRHFLDSGGDPGWHEAVLPEQAAGATIEDIHALPGERLLLVSDNAGLFIGDTPGSGLAAFNGGIGEISNGPAPRVIQAGNQAAVFLLRPAYSDGDQATTGGLWRYRALPPWSRLQQALSDLTQ